METQTQTNRTHAPQAPSRVVQRKCGCGNSGGGSGQCASCADEDKKLQRRAIGAAQSPEIPQSVDRVLGSAGRPLDRDTRVTMESRFGHDFSRVRIHTDTHAAASAHDIHAAAYTSGSHIVFGDRRFEPGTPKGRHLLAHELAHVVQQRDSAAIPAGIGAHDDVHERSADRTADAIVAHGAVFAPKPVARSAERLIRREGEDAERDPASVTEALIVDDAATPNAGQMKRADFVEELDRAVCATSSEEMRRLGRSTDGCPMLEQWRPKIRAMSSRQLEVSMRRWINNATNVRTAHDYIPRVQARLADGIRIWGATGSLAGIPPDLMDMLAGGTIRVSVGDLMRGAVGRLFRKARGGAAAPASTPNVALANGRPLDNPVASRMGRAIGADVSHVRIHTDSGAADAAGRLQARAFTIGSDIAFAQGEYRPGTLTGDALLAHELAHVSQQDGASGPLLASDRDSALEHDADNAAVHAMLSLWPNLRRFARGVKENAGARLKSGLRLSSCGVPRIGPEQMTRTSGSQQQADAAATGCASAERGGTSGTPRSCCTPSMLAEIRAIHPEAIARVQNAINVLAPDKASKYDEQLQRNFHITSANTTQVETIRSNYQAILDRMTGGNVQFLCRSRYADAECQHWSSGARSVFVSYDYAQTGGCSGAPLTMEFCGDYEQSLPPEAVPGSDQTAAVPQSRSDPSVVLRGEQGHRFLYPRNNENPEGSDTDGHNGWVRTLIHEYSHTICAGNIDAPPVMQRGNEAYQQRHGIFPSATPSTNPDSYAFFAMEVSRLA
ncbi:MAG TPA: DUF4157 domain-containing protein [Thermoanaerobaculia bacterium]